MLIDCSYFTKGSRKIHNATLGNTIDANSILVNETIESYIAENQEMYLSKILGASLGNKVNAYLVCLDDDDEPKHNEAFDAVCDRLREPFADYVFYRILRDINSKVYITELVIEKSANTPISPRRRQVTAWNSMVDKHRLFVAWCQTKECPLDNISSTYDVLTKINQFNI